MVVYWSFVVWLQLDEMFKKRGIGIDKVFNFVIDDLVLEERIIGRWIYLFSGRSYYIKFAFFKIFGVDDVRFLINYMLFVYVNFFFKYLLNN